MGEMTLMSEQQTDKNEYFDHGNIRIIISEHFRQDGKPLESIIEESLIRQARYDRKCFDPKKTKGK